MLPSHVLHLSSAAVSHGLPEAPVCENQTLSYTDHLSPWASRASGTFHVKGETRTGELQCRKESTQKHRWEGCRATHAAHLSLCHLLPTCSGAPCHLCPDPKMPTQQEVALGLLKRPGRRTPSQNILSLPPGDIYFLTLLGLLRRPVILGAPFTPAPCEWHPLGLCRLGSQCQQIRRRAESDTLLCSGQTMGTFPGSSGRELPVRGSLADAGGRGGAA